MVPIGHGVEIVERSMTRAMLHERVMALADDSPHENMANLAHSYGQESKPLCPVGLIEPEILSVIELDGHVDRLKTAPVAGGALDQPANILRALSIVSQRRALHQRRMIKQAEPSKAVS